MFVFSKMFDNFTTIMRKYARSATDESVFLNPICL